MQKGSKNQIFGKHTRAREGLSDISNLPHKRTSQVLTTDKNSSDKPPVKRQKFENPSPILTHLPDPPNKKSLSTHETTLRQVIAAKLREERNFGSKIVDSQSQ